ncbi:hypothetical protein MKK63_07270 [Methylobacterium sp. J-088]|uniref:hypothetical protein n=1 Tax=Methylobacterium sp. J-088 TaxID=2836664 RepID=UPI001FB8B13B|nr:hypothetical protein [Methylobacterium sp. J-088]MCJ2062504.1 hypothetical protein [Methylobacterium sp. J-088]
MQIEPLREQNIFSQSIFGLICRRIARRQLGGRQQENSSSRDEDAFEIAEMALNWRNYHFDLNRFPENTLGLLRVADRPGVMGKASPAIAIRAARHAAISYPRRDNTWIARLRRAIFRTGPCLT